MLTSLSLVCKSQRFTDSVLRLFYNTTRVAHNIVISSLYTCIKKFDHQLVTLREQIVESDDRPLVRCMGPFYLKNCPYNAVNNPMIIRISAIDKLKSVRMVCIVSWNHDAGFKFKDIPE